MITPVRREIRPQPGPQEQFLSVNADFVIYGGAAGGGKTFAVLLDFLGRVRNPKYRGVIYRRTYPEIMAPGGLWDESLNLYPHLGGIPQVGLLRWTFPSGAQIQFMTCQHEQDLMKHQGDQYGQLALEEITHFTRRMFFFFVSRIRSVHIKNAYMRGTCNPDADSWLAEFLSWWIDQDTGLAIPERGGVIRCFCILNDVAYWADTKEELLAQHPGCTPLTFTFIPAKVDDNKILLESDPGYLARMKALPYIEQQRLLHGNWKIKSNDGAYWQYNPEYFADHIWCDTWPESFEVSAMADDPSLGKTAKGDPSANIFVGYAGGIYYVDADIEVRTVQKLARDAILRHQQLEPDIFGCEGNGFQSLMKREYDIACQEMGIPVVPVALITNNVEKQIRIQRLDGYFEKRVIRIRRNKGGLVLLNQLRTFGIKDAHDDGPDCLEQTIRLLRAFVKGDG